MRKTYNIHKYDKCSLLSEDDADSNKLSFLIFKAYEPDSSMYGGLVVPSDGIINFTTALEDEFVQFFSNLTKVFDIAKDLLNKLLSIHLNIEF